MRWLVAVLCSVFLGGCQTGPNYYVNVSSITAPEVQSGMTYRVWPANDNVKVSDLQFREYAEQVSRALELRGFKRAAERTLPDVITFLDYGIGAPQTRTGSYNMPVYGQTGVASSTTTTTGTATANRFGNTVYGTGTATSTTTNTPQYGVIGSTTKVYSYTEYTRYIKVDAHFTSRWEQEKELVPAFTTEIVSTGSSGDLRKLFPIMLAGSLDYIASTTQGYVPVTLIESDPRIAVVMGLPPESK
ncbi:hypothetical protein [Hyphomonas sp.]|uniref:hypothetical protein n=1 Tax=Hyphomonas sp. TaxID=87 RepID=UPI0039194BC0